MTLKTGDTVLVTGGCGFIGSALIREIRSRYEHIHIRVIDDLSSGTRSNTDGLDVEMIEASILDEEQVKECLDGVDIIFHLAALPFIPDCYQNPYSFFDINTNATIRLFMMAIDSDARLFVCVSTSEVYGTAQSIPIDETHATNPHSTYAVSKLAAERAVYALHREHKFPAVIIRPFNTYGPRDSHPRIIPELIKQLHKDKELKLGNLYATRDFTYVEDTAKGVLLAAMSPRAIGRTINVCSKAEISVEELATLVADLVGKEKYRIIVEKERLRPYDVDRLYGDNTLARELLHWKPETTLKDGLERTIEWYRAVGKWRWE